MDKYKQANHIIITDKPTTFNMEREDTSERKRVQEVMEEEETEIYERKVRRIEHENPSSPNREGGRNSEDDLEDLLGGTSDENDNQEEMNKSLEKIFPSGEDTNDAEKNFQ